MNGSSLSFNSRRPCLRTDFDKLIDVCPIVQDKTITEIEAGLGVWSVPRDLCSCPCPFSLALILIRLKKTSPGPRTTCHLPFPLSAFLFLLFPFTQSIGGCAAWFMPSFSGHFSGQVDETRFRTSDLYNRNWRLCGIVCLPSTPSPSPSSLRGLVALFVLCKCNKL